MTQRFGKVNDVDVEVAVAVADPDKTESECEEVPEGCVGNGKRESTVQGDRGVRGSCVASRVQERAHSKMSLVRRRCWRSGRIEGTRGVKKVREEDPEEQGRNNREWVVQRCGHL